MHDKMATLSFIVESIFIGPDLSTLVRFEVQRIVEYLSNRT